MSAQSRRSSSTQNLFLFVNKDASTIRVHERDLNLDTAIQSHVQRQMHRRCFAESQIGSPILNDEATEKSNATAGSQPRNLLSAAHRPLHLTQSTSTSSSSDDPNSSLGEVSRVTSPLSACESIDRSRSRQSSVLDLTRSQSWSYSKTSAAAFLPITIDERLFSDQPPVLRKSAGILLNYWISVVLPEHFFFDSRSLHLSHSRYALGIARELHSAANSFPRLCALLAATAAHMLVREDAILISDLTDDERDNLVLTLKTMAIQAIRQQLFRGDIDHGLLYGVQHLFAAADLHEWCQDANFHREALPHLIEHFGGLQLTDAYFGRNSPEVALVWLSESIEYAASLAIEPALVSTNSVAAAYPIRSIITTYRSSIFP